jgi:hypothetical protein
MVSLDLKKTRIAAGFSLNQKQKFKLKWYQLGGFADSVHSGTTIWAGAFSSRFTVFHGNLLRVNHFFFSTTFNAVSLHSYHLLSRWIMILLPTCDLQV